MEECPDENQRSWSEYIVQTTNDEPLRLSVNAILRHREKRKTYPCQHDEYLERPDPCHVTCGVVLQEARLIVFLEYANAYLPISSNSNTRLIEKLWKVTHN